mmetsp:Transcript_5923/g.10650  ORF Transcript_5923/g.10650 Transcript_5923/m.10650 type:complete len:541 (-) Transcript_5923:381-2003(-)
MGIVRDLIGMVFQAITGQPPPSSRNQSPRQVTGTRSHDHSPRNRPKSHAGTNLQAQHDVDTGEEDDVDESNLTEDQRKDRKKRREDKRKEREKMRQDKSKHRGEDGESIENPCAAKRGAVKMDEIKEYLTFIERDEQLFLEHSHEVTSLYLRYQKEPLSDILTEETEAQAKDESLKTKSYNRVTLEMHNTAIMAKYGDEMPALLEDLGKNINEEIFKLQKAMINHYVIQSALRAAKIATMFVPGGMGVHAAIGVGSAVTGKSADNAYMDSVTTATAKALKQLLLDFNAKTLEVAKQNGSKKFTRVMWVCQPLALTDEQYRSVQKQLHLDVENYLSMARKQVSPTDAAMGKVSEVQIFDLTNKNVYVTPDKPAAEEKSLVHKATVAENLGKVLDGEGRRELRSKYGPLANLKFKETSVANEWKREKATKYKGVPIKGKYILRQSLLVLEDSVDEYIATMEDQKLHIDQIMEHDKEVRPKVTNITGKEDPEPFLIPIERVFVMFPFTGTDWDPRQTPATLFSMNAAPVARPEGVQYDGSASD